MSQPPGWGPHGPASGYGPAPGYPIRQDWQPSFAPQPPKRGTPWWAWVLGSLLGISGCAGACVYLVRAHRESTCTSEYSFFVEKRGAGPISSLEGTSSLTYLQARAIEARDACDSSGMHARSAYFDETLAEIANALNASRKADSAFARAQLPQPTTPPDGLPIPSPAGADDGPCGTTELTSYTQPTGHFGIICSTGNTAAALGPATKICGGKYKVLEEGSAKGMAMLVVCCRSSPSCK